MNSLWAEGATLVRGGGLWGDKEQNPYILLEAKGKTHCSTWKIWTIWHRGRRRVLHCVALQVPDSPQEFTVRGSLLIESWLLHHNFFTKKIYRCCDPFKCGHHCQKVSNAGCDQLRPEWGNPYKINDSCFNRLITKQSDHIRISGSWWWTGRLGVLRFMGSQSRKRLSDWT